MSVRMSSGAIGHLPRSGLWGDAFRVPRTERYEYRCPYCGYINIRYERTRRIVCDKCGRSFGTWQA